MKEWLEMGKGALLVGGVAGVGILIRMLLFGYYGKMYRECRRFETSRYKPVVYIREDLKQRAGKGQEIKNAMTYTESRLAECKVMGMRTGWLENMMLHSILLVFLCGGMTSLSGVLLRCEEQTVLILLFVSGVTVLGLLAVDMIFGLRDKYRRIRLFIRDYIENNWSVRAEWQEDNLLPEELAGQVMKNEAEPRTARLTKAVTKDKPVKEERRKKGKAQEEKRRLTEELLRERRQLEARSFAEQRKKEQDEQEVVRQVQEEAAVTMSRSEELPVCGGDSETEKGLREKEQEKKGSVFSYELLMSEVLAEYLA